LPPRPNATHGLLPFWFLNGELDPDEMRRQLRELAEQGMAGVVLHARYGLALPYLGEEYRDRIALAVDEARRLGLEAWIYDELNWPSGTAGGAVLRERPDLAQRYLECISFEVSGPWFTYLTGGDDRYLPLAGAEPVAAFALGEDGTRVDLTSQISFGDVVSWTVPPGRWRLVYLVEKRAPHYLDALDPEATQEFIRLGYEPYPRDGVAGFYTDEPAMQYHRAGAELPIVPWTKDLLALFEARNGYDLRPRLPDLFFEGAPDAARVRFDFYETLTERYSSSYYGQLAQWCRERGLRFTGHLLYEERPRLLVRTEGNPFAHYRHFDVIGVDHLYAVVGDRWLPQEHVALKLASSAARHFGSERVLCESFGGIGLDATLERMKRIGDWQFALGVNLLNPHGYHYSLEGDRKRDWPPSMFYQYPWWRYFRGYADYVARTSEFLSGGRALARIAVLWPMTSLFASFRPQERDEISTRIEDDFLALTDALLRLHRDFDYLDESIAPDDYELVVLPPLTHLKLETVARLERFCAEGGRVLACVRAPEWAFDGEGGIVDVRERVASFARVLPLERIAYPDDYDATLAALREALEGLLPAELAVGNREVLSLQRERDGRRLLFLANPTLDEQPAEVALAVAGQPYLLDPETGEERAVYPAGLDELGRVRFAVTLPPAGSACIAIGAEPAAWISETNVVVDGFQAGSVDAHGRVEEARVEVVRDGARIAVRAAAPPPSPALVLGGDWQVSFAAPNVLPLAVEPAPGPFARLHPSAALPAATPYRASFEVRDVPPDLGLLVDGFSSDAWTVLLNGEAVEGPLPASGFDCEIGLLDLTALVRPGRNALELRLEVAERTDGLLDAPKLAGSFAVVDGAIVAAPATLPPEPVTGHGFPFFSGVVCYRRRFHLPAELAGQHLALHVDVGDDVVEAVVNGRVAGVRLWEPYELDVSPLVEPGENLLELRVANTAANVFGCDPRPSGLRAAPRLVPSQRFRLPLPEAAGEPEIEAVDSLR
jgi:hypothetical protein